MPSLSEQFEGRASVAITKEARELADTLAVLARIVEIAAGRWRRLPVDTVEKQALARAREILADALLK